MNRRTVGLARLFLSIIGLLTVAFVHGCVRKSGGGRSGGEKLTIISPHYEGIRKEYENAFNAFRKSQGKGEVKFEYIDQGGTSDDLRFVKSEFARTPTGIKIDLFWGGGVDPYRELRKMNLLDRYQLPEEELKALAKEVNGVPVYDPEGYWYGTAMSGFGIMYNKPLLKQKQLPEPKMWDDIARPVFYNLVTGTDPRHSGSAHMMFEIVLQAYGWEKGFDVLGRIAGNSRAFSDSSTQVPKDVSQGEAAAAPVIDFYAWSETQNVGGKVGFVYPAGMTVINPDGIGILKGAPNKSLAQEFVSFTLSDAGQKLLMLPPGTAGGPKEFTLHRMCVLPALYESLKGTSIVDINPFHWKSRFIYDSSKGSARWDIVNDLIGALMIDPHNALQAAVKARGSSTQPLVIPPISEADALQLAQGKWKDATFRNQMISNWTEQARTRYKT